MMNLIDIPNYRQATSHTCGPCALLSVLVYYGFCHDDESSLAKKINCDPRWGSDPGDIIKLLESYGLKTIARSMTLDNIESFVKEGIPTIVAYQAWSESDEQWDDCWDDGHYSIVIGIDAENVYFEDPSLIGQIGYIPREEFMSRWHDIDRSGNSLYHYGIAVIGQQQKQKLHYQRID